MIEVIMPLSPMSAERFRVASWIKQRLEAPHLWYHWSVTTADTNTRPWSKSHAANEAVRSSRADVLVIHDADVICSPEAMTYAVEAVLYHGHSWAVPHGDVYRLPEATTANVLALRPASVIDVGVPAADFGLTRQPYRGLPGGGLFVVSRDAWDAVGGFDERFIGWGSEDVSIGWALDTLAGPHWRDPDPPPLWHLWHPIEPRGMELYENQRLEECYRQANGDPDAMRELADGRGCLTAQGISRHQ